MAAQIGGTFAPPLTDALLERYSILINQLPKTSQIREILDVLFNCCKQWWVLPESTNKQAAVHPSGIGAIIHLDEDIKKKLWDHIPWTNEIEMFKGVLDSIDPISQRELRNAAFHLLWHVVELDIGREPLTNDKL